MQRGQTGPFWYVFVTETVLEMEMEGEGIKKTWELGGTPGEIRTPDPMLPRQPQIFYSLHPSSCAS